MSRPRPRTAQTSPIRYDPSSQRSPVPLDRRILTRQSSIIDRAVKAQVTPSSHCLPGRQRAKSVLYHNFSAAFLPRSRGEERDGENTKRNLRPGTAGTAGTTRAVQLLRAGSRMSSPVNRASCFSKREVHVRQQSRPRTAQGCRSQKAIVVQIGMVKEETGRRAEMVYRRRTEEFFGSPTARIKRRKMQEQDLLSQKKLSKLEKDIEKHQKVLDIENRRCFTKMVPQDMEQEKGLLERVLTTYRFKLIDEQRRLAEERIKAKEKFIETLDSAVVDLEKIAIHPEQSMRPKPSTLAAVTAKKSVAEVVDRSGRDEDEEEKGILTKSKYQASFLDEVTMRKAFNRNFAFVEPDEEVKRLRRVERHLPANLLNAETEAEQVTESLKERCLSEVMKRLRETEGDLKSLAWSNSLLLKKQQEQKTASDDTSTAPTLNMQTMLDAIQAGDKDRVQELLERYPKLVSEVDQVFLPNIDMLLR